MAGYHCPKQVELSLKTANQEITTIWESMTDAYMTIDRDWRIVYANSAADRIFYPTFRTSTFTTYIGHEDSTV